MARRSLRSRLLRGLAVVGVVLVVLLAAVRLRYGGGDRYADVTTVPDVPADRVETLVAYHLPLGNVTSAPGGRIFFNVHPFARADRFAHAYFFELVDGEPQPYPDAAAQADLRFTFGMTVDAEGRLWVISPATLDRDRTRLQAFDLATNTRVVDHEFEEGVARFSQDLRVTKDGKTMILADTGAFRFTSASILVVDLETFAVREVLAGHPTLQPQNWMTQTAHGGQTVGYGLVTFSVGIDGIAFSPDEAWLYYAPMSHDTLFRIPTEALLDPSRSDAELAEVIEAVGTKPLSDGIETTADGEVLVTDIEHGAIMGFRPDGSRRTLVKLDSVVWADGVNVTDGGDVLLTDSGIPSYLHPLLLPPDPDVLAAGAPYGLYRIRPDE